MVGVSVDRRTFGHVTEVYNSASVRSLICACCAQIHTDTKSGRFNAFAMTTGDDQLLRRLERQAHGRGDAARRINFDQENYTQRYASEGPMLNAPELARDSWEWRQTLRVGGGSPIPIVCCPEDVA